MEARALLRYERIAPRKVRVVADLIRGRAVDEAINILMFSEKGAARVLKKVLMSAIANAEDKSSDVDTDALFIKEVTVDQGPTLKRWRPRAMGRATRINKRTSHIRIVLDDGNN
jgi:large subunit ribosomal protein L22